MIYLSQLINKTVYCEGKPLGKLLDMAVFENRPTPPVSKIMIKKADKKVTLAPLITIEEDRLTLKDPKVPFLPYDENDFYLNEDLLDKQVIDTDGKRLVRVNDVLLESNGELKVIGIDIGLSGILRRLGLGGLIRLKPRTLPWTLIEAFDYQTGAIRIKLTQNRLNNFHPSELADILEEVGTKERMAIVDILDAQKAAEAIEEADTQTQSSILEQVPSANLKNIVNKMLVSKVADIFYRVNPLRSREILKSVDTEKATLIKHLSSFPHDTAGGLMDLYYCEIDGEKTVKEALSILAQQHMEQEAIIVINGDKRFLGFIYLKNLLGLDNLALLKDIISEKKFVLPDTDFSQILRIFSNYNLHVLPVVDRDKKVLGVITIDTILAKIEEEREKYGVV